MIASWIEMTNIAIKIRKIPFGLLFFIRTFGAISNYLSSLYFFNGVELCL